MSATDELRRLLTEQDVEYESDDSCHLCSHTRWKCDIGDADFYEDHTNCYTEVTIDYKDGMTRFEVCSNLHPPERYVTPEQAIEATLGKERTCETCDHCTYIGEGDFICDRKVECNMPAPQRETAEVDSFSLAIIGLSMSQMATKLERMENENARLRELVRDMALNMGGCALHGNPLRLREFINRARELGIEVDE